MSFLRLDWRELHKQTCQVPLFSNRNSLDQSADVKERKASGVDGAVVTWAVPFVLGPESL